MTDLKRFGVSIEKNLIEKFDTYISGKNYSNRSEALRDLIRKELVDNQWIQSSDGHVAGAIVIVYNHHKRELVDNLVRIQHDYNDLIIASQHIHLDHDNCLEAIIVKGRIQNVIELEAKLKSVKGVVHSELARSTLGKDF